MTRHRCRVRGFTLVEMLVALTILALVAAALSASMWASRPLFTRLTAGEETVDLDLMRRLLGLWLDDALCRAPVEAVATMPCTGNSRQLRFVIAAADGLVRYDLRIVNVRSRLSLVLARQRMRDLDTPLEMPAVTRVLAADLDHAVFSWWDPASDTWQRSDWTAPVPALVRLDLRRGSRAWLWVFRPRVR